MKSLPICFLISIFITGNWFAAADKEKTLSGSVILKMWTHMDLSEGNYTVIKNDTFSDFTEIVYLSLAKNYIRVLPEAVFSRLKNLTKLNLSGNLIENLTNAFVGLSNLEYLDLSNNLLKSLGSNFFAGLTSRCHINIKHNELLHLPIQGDVFGSGPSRSQDVGAIDSSSAKPEHSESLSERKIIQLQMCTHNSTFVQLNVRNESERPTDNCDLVWPDNMYTNWKSLSSVNKGWYQVTDNVAMAANVSEITINQLESDDLISGIVNELPVYIKKLHMQGGSISRLKKGTLKHNGMVELFLTYHRIKVIEPDAFDMPKLKILKLYKNELNESNLLKTLPLTIEDLDLSYNMLTKITADFLAHLSNLKVLTLRGNEINTIELGAFKQLHNLEELSLSENKITDVRLRNFAMPNVKILKLDHNRLHNISALATLQPTIETLDLGWNVITAITANNLYHLKNVRALFLHGNNITIIELGALKHLQNLEELSLSDNKITDVSLSNFDIPNVKILNLDNNLLHNISSLATLPSTIQKLYLGLNKFTTITADAFSHLSNLEELSLYENEIVTIELGAFKHLQKLRSLDLNKNGIVALNAGIFTGLRNLEILLLSFNSLTRLNAGVFDLPKLISLNVNGNSITMIEKGVFRNSSELCKLELFGNDIHKFGNSELFGLQKRSSCYVTLSDIEFLEGGVFDDV